MFSYGLHGFFVCQIRAIDFDTFLFNGSYIMWNIRNKLYDDTSWSSDVSGKFLFRTDYHSDLSVHMSNKYTMKNTNNL